MTEGICYFGLTNLFTFDFVTARDTRGAIKEWAKTLTEFSDSMI
jgi:hypothetical protein